MRRSRGCRGAADQLDRPRVDDHRSDAVPVALGQPPVVAGDRVAESIYCRYRQRRHYSRNGYADHPGPVGGYDPKPAAVFDTSAAHDGAHDAAYNSDIASPDNNATDDAVDEPPG